MALDATVAGASADSYLTVAEADAFAAVRLGRFAEKWLDADTTDDNKEDALKQATADIDAYVRVSAPYDDLQALAFPRLVDVDTAGDPFLVKRVKEACYEQAAYVLSTAPLQDDAAERRARGLFTFTENDVSGSLAVAADFGRMAPRAQQLLDSVVATRSLSSGSTRLRSATVAAWQEASS